MPPKSLKHVSTVFTCMTLAFCFVLFTSAQVISGESDISESLKTTYGGIDFTIRNFSLNYNYDPTNQDKRPPKISLSMTARLPLGQKSNLYNQNAYIDRVIYDNGWEPTADEITQISEKVERRQIEAVRWTDDGWTEEKRGSPRQAGESSRQILNVNLHLPLPTRDAKHIKILDGVVSMYSQEPELRSVLIPLTDTINAEPTAAGAYRLKLKNVKGEGYKRITIDAEISGKTDVKSHSYYDWKLLSNNGKECRSTSRGSSERDKKITFNITFPCPGKIEEFKGLSASWYDDEGGNKIDIPFTFRDVPLP